MGLSKRITLSSGIQTNYHRIVTLVQHVNNQTIIEVASYTSRGKRVDEQNQLAANETVDAFIETVYYNLPYDPDMNVPLAYEYLKSLPEFAGSTDVIEGE